MLQRALVRLGLPLCYSAGFNPRPRMSLPLPRTVGVGSDDDILCARVDMGDNYDPDVIRDGLCRQLPDQCVVKSVSVSQSKVTFQPLSAVYVFPLKPSALTEKVIAAFQTLKNAAGGNTPIIVNRKSGKGKSTRKVDLSCYIDSLKIEDNIITVKCLITREGSIRVDEIMQQIGITAKDISSPIKRTAVEWSDC